MLLSISICFFLFSGPAAAFQIYNTYVVGDVRDITLFLWLDLTIANQFIILLLMINHSINLILYSLTGRKFRNEMLSMITCGKYQVKRKNLSTVTRTSNMSVTSTVATVSQKVENGKSSLLDLTKQNM